MFKKCQNCGQTTGPKLYEFYVKKCQNCEQTTDMSRQQVQHCMNMFKKCQNCGQNLMKNL